MATSTPTPTATATPTAAVLINYGFDHLDRLTHADYTGGSTIDYTYDVMGNRLTQNSNIGAIGNTTYGYATNNRLTSINGSTTGLAYDANGNMTSRRENGITWTQTYDFENRLTQASSTAGTWNFTYDGDGARVKQVAANGDVTAYVGGLYEVTYTSGGTLKNTKLYYTFGAQVVAMRDVSGSGGTLYYLHGDNLGSASLTTNASGAVVSQNKYYPFGASRLTQGTRPTDLDFTGQRLDGTGLHFYNARYYDSLLGRFVQADTVTPGMNSQAYNRYAYVINNPLKYTDPTGHCFFGLDTLVCVAVAIAGGIIVGKLAYDHAVGPALGQMPDSTGIADANKYRASIEAAAGQDLPPIAVAAGLSVQDQWCCGIVDHGEVWSGDKRPSLGIAQLTSDEARYFPNEDFQPFDANASIIALAAKMKGAADNCAGCSTTDLFIALGTAHNDGAISAEPINGDPQYRDWDTYFNNKADMGGLRGLRLLLSNSRTWERHLLRLFINDLKELANQGWELPDNLDLDRMQCLADSGKISTCNP
jgi:RHS repeat-associated protein